MKFYKIRNRRTGLWSKVGMDALAHREDCFNKTGKTWNTPGHVRSHLAGLVFCHEKSREQVLQDLEVVEFSIEQGTITPAADFHLKQ
jgi:hypothetical protein